MLTVVLNTQTWWHQIWRTVKMTIILEMDIRNYKEFPSINNSLQWHDENEDYEEAVVEQTAIHQKTSEDQETENNTPEHYLSDYDATKCIAGQLYFMQEGNKGNPTSALETRADFAQLQTIKGTWQGALNQFFHQ